MKPAAAPGTRECEHEGCHARVMVSSGHRCCQRHRPRKPRIQRRKSAAEKKAQRDKQRRERESLGVAGGWTW